MSPIGRNQDLIDKLARWMDAPDQKKVKTNGHATLTSKSGSPPRTDQEIIEGCRAADNAAKFEALFNGGDVDTYHGGDDSAADLALMSILAFHTQDPGQLEGIFSASALGQRAKWGREDYRTRTIDKALSGLGETWQAGRERSYPIGKGAGDSVTSSLYSKSASHPR